MAYKMTSHENDMWWYWQHYRSWVPYSRSLVGRIESSFLAGNLYASSGALFHLNGHGYNIDFHFSHDSGSKRPHQVRVGAAHLHREVSRLPAPQGFIPEHSLVHMDFATLKWMADVQRKQRLTTEEIENGVLSRTYSRSCLQRTLAEINWSPEGVGLGFDGERLC